MVNEHTVIISGKKDPSIPSAFRIPASKRFKIIRVLGRGAFGIVYLAEDKKIGRLVAIKQLFGAHENQNDIRERFMQEAKIAGQLAHPNIVIVYNIEENEKEPPSIVMEYLGGGSLDDLLNKEHTLDFRVATRIMLGILSGLGAAHNIKVVHRDIKPQNIVFSIGSTPKITDFGIARLPVMNMAETQSIILSAHHEKTSIMGTPMYMSPEQITGAETSAGTDLYSAGIIFYRMLAGRTLFEITQENCEIEKIREMVLKNRPEKLKKFRKDIPNGFDDVIFRLLEKNPSNRYPDAEAAVRDILKILSSTPSDLSINELIFPYNQVSISSSAIFDDMLHIILADGIITSKARIELNKRAEKLGITQAAAKIAEERIRSELKLSPLKLIEKFEKAVAAAVIETRGQDLQQKHLVPLKALQREMKISDNEAREIFRYLTNMDFF